MTLSHSMASKMLASPLTPSSRLASLSQAKICHSFHTSWTSFADPLPDLADNYRATIAVNSKPNFLINEADEAEKAAASAGFYGGFTVEEPPSPYHAPVTDQTSGFGDIRDGAEAFPQQWQDNERRPRACTLAEADAMVEDHPMDATSISTRPILMPIPRKTAAVRSQHNRVYSPMVIGHTSEDSSEMESNTSGRNNSSSHRHGIDDHEGKKRKVHDQSFFDTNSSGMLLCRAI